MLGAVRMVRGQLRARACLRLTSGGPVSCGSGSDCGCGASGGRLEKRR
jgi:hypothetical protein